MALDTLNNSASYRSFGSPHVLADTWETEIWMIKVGVQVVSTYFCYTGISCCCCPFLLLRNTSGTGQIARCSLRSGWEPERRGNELPTSWTTKGMKLSGASEIGEWTLGHTARAGDLGGRARFVCR